MVLVTGVTVTVFKSPITSWRERISTGRRLSGGLNSNIPISPRLSVRATSLGPPSQKIHHPSRARNQARTHQILRDRLGILRNRLRGRARFANATVKFVPRRTDIAAALNGFETPGTRRRYVDWLEQEAGAHAHLTALADIVANPWPDGRRPNRDNDAASTRLAQLDERRLKLDV